MSRSSGSDQDRTRTLITLGFLVLAVLRIPPSEPRNTPSDRSRHSRNGERTAGGGSGMAEAVAESATHALDLIRKARALKEP
jgi:hypothetical protein